MGWTRLWRTDNDPQRLNRFLDALNSADWQGKPQEALDVIFNAINELVYHHVLF